MNGFPSFVGFWDEAFLEEVVTIGFQSRLGDRWRLLASELKHDCELVVKVCPWQLQRLKMTTVSVSYYAVNSRVTRISIYTIIIIMIVTF